MLAGILWFLYIFQRRLIKWIFHYFTGSCELLRIVHSRDSTLNKTKNIEYSLRLSKNSFIRNFYSVIKEFSVDSFSTELVKIKHIKPHHNFQQSVGPFLTCICSYERLVEEVEKERKNKYSSENPQHETSLLQLWKNLKPDLPLTSRRCNLWQEIGFQGNDPATDFRGMGILGLNCLLHFSSVHSSASKQLLLHSIHPQYGYFYAVVAINITSLTHHFLTSSQLKDLFYANPAACHLKGFYEVFSHLFMEFDKYWRACEPASIMEFERRRREFESVVAAQLREGTFELKIRA